MLNNKQKFYIHHYKSAAALDEATYRAVLREGAGCRSAADKRFSQSGFDRCMAHLETLLFQRVDHGEVANPIPLDKWIRQRSYWRDKLPKRGLINAQQERKIYQLWVQLCRYLPEEKRIADYCGGIIRQATGRTVLGTTTLTMQEAGFVIDALKDRLRYAIGQPVEENELPF